MMAHKSKRVQDKEDVSVLRTPIQLHGKTVEQILNGVHYGTPELRSLLLDECDIIFECKVCRALFRDLPNFISHKRGYCSKSATEDNHLAIARIPDEKVYVVHPQEPQFHPAEISRKPKSKPSLEETIARIQSGELGHSHAFKVYSDAANKLQRQKEDMKIATIRTTAIPTNPNAVFVDVNVASVNIHERSAAASSHPSKNSSSNDVSTFKRKAGERVSANRGKGLTKKDRGRILRKDCKNSEELQKLLLNGLKEIQYKVKQKSQSNNSLKDFSHKGSSPKVGSTKLDVNTSPSLRVVEMKQNVNQRTETSRRSSDSSIASGKAIVNHSLSYNKVNHTSTDFKHNDGGHLPSDVTRPKTTKRGQVTEKRTIIDDDIPFGDSTYESLDMNLRVESPEMDLIRVDRQSLGTSTSRNKHSTSDILGITNTFSQNGENISKDKESKSSKLVSSVSRRQHSRLFDSKDKGNQSTIRKNSKSPIIKSESFDNFLSKPEIPAASFNTCNSEESIKSKSSRSSPSSRYSLRRKELICSICHGIFSSRQSLSFHKKIKHSSLKTFYPCLYCPSIFYYFHGVTRHLKLQHSKSKSEVNSLRQQLRTKAYMKLLPEKEDDTEMIEQSKGLRKSLRFKQEAFSSQTSPDSSFVLHSVKKIGKKLSAKKDALSTTQSKEQPKEFSSSNDKRKSGKSSNNSDIKQEIINPVAKLASKDLSNSQEDVANSKGKVMRKNSNLSPLSPKSSPSGHIRLHACKKCKRLFGRYLTYKNHIKTCLGKVTVLCRQRRGKPLKNAIVHGNRGCSTVLTRNQKKRRGRKTSGVERNLSKDLTSSFQSKQITRSSGKDVLGYVNSVKQEDSESESSHLSRRKRPVGIDNSKEEQVLTSSLSTSQLNDSASVDKDDHMDISKSKRNKEPTEVNDNKIQTEKSLKTMSLEMVNTSTPKMIDNDNSVDTLDSANSMTKPKTRTLSQKLTNQSANIVTNSIQTTEDDEKDNKKVSQSIRNSRSMRDGEISAPEIVTLKSKPTPVVIERERRTSSVERDVRGKISHLVPRFPTQNSSSNKEVKEFSSSVSANEARPKRKRKVPIWNMDAMEMLSKIHNPEKDMPPMKKKKVSKEIETSSCSKSTRGRTSLNDKNSSNVGKAQTGISEEGRSKEEKEHAQDNEFKEVKVSKNLSRIFNLGRKKSRGRKLLRSYANARVDKLIDVQNCKCLVCGETCSQLFNLRRHVIRIHLHWSRYQCKLCRFSSFDRSECTTHIIRNHHRDVDIKSSQEIDSYITDLAKQTSQIMNMKKNQTLLNKSKVQNKETNIYARPNVRKMPRLAERTLIYGRKRESPSSVDKERPDYCKSAEDNVKLKHSLKSETMSHEALDIHPTKNSLPFNISTRNSPRVFDIRPYKSRDSSDAQGEVVVLHTRKGVYTKTVPSLHVRDNSESETLLIPKDKKSVTIDDCETGIIEIIEKAPLVENVVSSSKYDISDDLALMDTSEIKSDEEHLSKNKQLSEKPKCDAVLSINKEIEKEEVVQQNPSNNKDSIIINDPISYTTKLCPKKSIQSDVAVKDKETDSTTVVFIAESQHCVSKVKSSSINMSPTVSLVNSPKAKRLIPSYVNYRSTLPDASSSTTSSATKVLSFSSECPNTSKANEPTSNCVSSVSMNATVRECKSKSTLLDDIDAETSAAAVLDSAASGQTPPNSDNE